MNGLTPIVIVLGLAYAFYKLVELFARRKERMALIEKIDLKSGIVVSPDMIDWLSPSSRNIFTSLKIGLLLTGLGLGLILAIIYINIPDLSIRDRDMVYLASMMFFGGLGLVIAYLVENKKEKK
ncbi:MAG: DUF6249 domain-containing protein [Bacteroidales bacterium]|nr:DUF6249 domain-containing protein [Bacteroidales bacterium]